MAEFYRGSPSMRDYTPTADVAAGQVVLIGTNTYVAHRDIAANQLGALAAPTGTAAYKVRTNQNIADGAAVLVNLTTGIADGTGSHLGYAEGAADGTTTETDVIVRHVEA